MKIEIYKKSNDENVYFSYEEKIDLVLNFENIKNFSKIILNNKKDGEDVKYEVTSDTSLVLYKTTLEDVINSIINDEELFNLYKDNIVVESKDEGVVE